MPKRRCFKENEGAEQESKGKKPNPNPYNIRQSFCYFMIMKLLKRLYVQKNKQGDQSEFPIHVGPMKNKMGVVSIHCPYVNSPPLRFIRRRISVTHTILLLGLYVDV